MAEKRAPRKGGASEREMEFFATLPESRELQALQQKQMQDMLQAAKQEGAQGIMRQHEQDRAMGMQRMMEAEKEAERAKRKAQLAKLTLEELKEAFQQAQAEQPGYQSPPADLLQESGRRARQMAGPEREQPEYPPLRPEETMSGRLPQQPIGQYWPGTEEDWKIAQSILGRK